MKKKIKIIIHYDDGSIEELTGKELKKLLWNLDHVGMMPKSFYESKIIKWKKVKR